jgi:glucose-1-phosphate adenylyltransferase
VAGEGDFKSRTSKFVEVLHASQPHNDNWSQGTADAVYQNLDIIGSHQPEHILILSGEHVYHMDYRALLAQHVKSKAEMTVYCIEKFIEETAGDFGVMTINTDNRVIVFNEKLAVANQIPGKPVRCLASMGNYVFNTTFLFEQLNKDHNNENSRHDISHDIIPSIIDECDVFTFSFKDPNTNLQPYW